MVTYCYLFALLALATACRFRSRAQPFDPYPFDRVRTYPLRGLLALFVVIGHCDLRIPGSGLLKALHLSTPAVSVFFFLSGYGLMKSLQRDRAGYLYGFLPRALVKLGIPLATATALACLFLFVRDEPVNLLHRGYELITRGRNFPYHSWYVYALLIHYLGFRLVFARGTLRRGLVLFALFSLAYYAVFRFGLHGPGVWWRTTLAMPIGACWAWNEARIQALLRRSAWKVCLAACVAAGVGIICHRFAFASPGVMKEIQRAFLLMLGPGVAIVLLTLRGVPRPIAAAGAFLGGISFEIYLLHFLGERGFDRFFPDAPVPYCCAALALAVVVSWPMHGINAALERLVRRASPRLERKG